MSFLHMVKVNNEVNYGILACDWPIAWLTSWLTLTMYRKDRPSVGGLMAKGATCNASSDYVLIH